MLDVSYAFTTPPPQGRLTLFYQLFTSEVVVFSYVITGCSSYGEFIRKSPWCRRKLSVFRRTFYDP